jgi:hypothetical protein
MKLEAAPAKRAKVHTVYRLADGTKVPGVTTVLGVINKPALMNWAWQLGTQGIDYKHYVDATARIGTLAHEMIQEYLGGPDWDRSAFTREEIDTAENAVLSFFEWEKQTGYSMKTFAIEMPVVSEKYRYGGTVDWLGSIDASGGYWLVDFKTSKALYPEHEWQTSAYYKALLELGYKIKGVRLLRIGRSSDEGFDDHVLSKKQLESGWKVFLSALKLYQAKYEYECGKKYGFKGAA